MSMTAPDDLVKEGMNPEQAKMLAAVIDTPGASAVVAIQKLMGCGFSPTLATELGTQCYGGTGTVASLAALGIPHNLAAAIKTAIDAV